MIRRALLVPLAAMAFFVARPGNAVAADVPGANFSAATPSPATLIAALSQMETASPPSAAPDAQIASGLPQREPPPRTLSAFWPAYVGFVAALFAIIAYVLTGVSGRNARLARMLDELDGTDPS